MKADLYQDAIVALAKEAARAGRLEAADASITLDNPLCGDRVTIDVKLAGDRIVDLAHRVRGCLLCEASAAVIGANAVGETAVRLKESETGVRAMLEGKSTTTTLWPGFEAFVRVADYRSRHACVLLPLEALREAVAAARTGKSE
jgi:nitrogen fixation NifU-like protein